MRCYRHPRAAADSSARSPARAPGFPAPSRLSRLLATAALATAVVQWPVRATDSPEPPTPVAVRQSISLQDQAALLAQRTIERLALGDAFDAKLRQRIWVGGREVVGIGHYEQSGGGTGRFSFEMTIHDGDSRQSIRQISDGKLAWIHTQLGDSVTLRRVDLGRIDEVYRELTRPTANPSVRQADYGTILAAEELTPPWMRVGGLVELVDRIAADYDLRVGKGTVDDRPVWILRGVLSERAQARIQAGAEREELTPLCPYEVRLAVAAAGDARGFGIGLPVRMEFWSPPNEPTGGAAANSNSTSGSPPQATTGGPSGAPRGRLISLLEIYAVRRIEPSPEERFRFKRDDPDVIFSNDTRRYLDRLVP